MRCATDGKSTKNCIRLVFFCLLYNDRLKRIADSEWNVWYVCFRIQTYQILSGTGKVLISISAIVAADGLDQLLRVDISTHYQGRAGVDKHIICIISNPRAFSLSHLLHNGCIFFGPF